MNSRVLDYFIFLMLLALCTGCSDESASVDEEPERIILNLAIRMAQGNSDLPSRADDDFEGPANGNETPKKLTVVIARPVEDDLTHENVMEVEHARTLECSVNWDVRPEIFSFNVSPGEKSIYLFGNPESLPDKDLRTTISNLTQGDILPDFSESKLTRESGNVFFSNTADIPFSEYFDVTVDPVNSAGTNKEQTATLFITRIPVKFTIRSNIRLSGAEINSIATTQYLLPHNTTYSPAKDKDVEPEGGYEKRSITKFETPAPETVTPFEWEPEYSATVDVDGTNYYGYEPVYLMETETPADGFSLAIKPMNQDWTAFQPFPNLDILPRNTHVLVNVTKQTDGSINVSIKVKDWRTLSYRYEY